MNVKNFKEKYEKIINSDLKEHEKIFAIDLLNVLQSPHYFLSSHCKIESASEGLVPFNLYDYQTDLLNTVEDNRFTFILKSRQLGFTTIMAAYSLWMSMRQGENVLLLSRREDDSMKILRKIKIIYENLDKKFHEVHPLKSSNATTIEFENKNRIMSLPATERSGAGDTASLIVLDEFSAFPAAKDQIAGVDVWTAIIPTISTNPNAKVVVGSTPKGMGNHFANLWHGENGFAKKMYHWTQNPKYNKGLRERETQEDGYGQYVSDWSEPLMRNMTPAGWAQEFNAHVKDTFVLMKKGKTKSVYDLTVGEELSHWNNEETKLLKKKNVGQRQILKVKTECGTTFDASTDHAVSDKKRKTKLKNAKTLEYVFTNIKNDDEDEAMARLIAYNLSDGTVCLRDGQGRRKKYHQASFYSENYNDLKRLAEDTVIAGLRRTAPNVLLKKGKINTYQFHLTHYSADELVRKGAVVVKKVQQKYELPEWIIKSKKNVQKEFLASLWGAEGSTIKESQKSDKSMTQPIMAMHKVNKKDAITFFNQIVELHKNLGVNVSLKIKKSITGYCFNIGIIGGKQGYLDFINNINYSCCLRKKKKAFLWKYYLMAQLNTKGLIEPFEKWIKTRKQKNSLFIKIIDKEIIRTDTAYHLAVSSSDHTYLLADGMNNFNCDFVQSGRPVFNWASLVKTQIQEEDLNFANHYVCGVDLASGSGNDWHVAQFICVETGRQVETYRSKEPLDIFGINVMDKCKKYNTAKLAFENNSGYGITFMKYVKNYPNLYYQEKVNKKTFQRTSKLGWNTNKQSKELMITDLNLALINKEIFLTDDKTISECKTYQYDDQDRMNATAGMNDDAVTSLAIAWQVAKGIRPKEKVEPSFYRPAGMPVLPDAISSFCKKPPRDWRIG